ncbi:MAG TPA: DUF4118 domain-containing protein, partial [Noviherbaspirillum sp.]|uniref:DUF4118 domain-containing protein n=1 Tax=Noviherbaspirillum sp. TaxID=1926288 RepID=UPI002DDC9837
MKPIKATMQRRKWIDSKKGSAVRSYVVAFLAVAVCASLQYAVLHLLQADLPPALPLTVLLAPVIISAMYGGAMPALFAAVLALAAGAFLFLQPILNFWIAYRQDRVMVLAFAFISLLIAFMGALLERAREKAAAAKLALQQSDQTVRALLQSASAAVVGFGPDGKISIANDAVFNVFGYRSRELIGQPVDMVLPDVMRKPAMPTDKDVSQESRAMQTGKCRETPGKKKNGDPFPAELTLGSTDTPNGPLTIAYIADIGKRKANEAQALHAAKHDSLTGLPNRALMLELAAQLLGAARRGNARAAVLMIDVDRFKSVNERY